MKLIVVANDMNHFNMLNKLNISNIVLSSKYSSYRQSFSYEEIEKCFEINQNIFISFYDLINEDIIDEVTEYIDKLVKLGVNNFIVNDSGIVYYLKDKNVNVILDNITLNTNYESLNIWKEFGVSSAVLGREITLDEINEISEHSELETIVHIQGLVVIFTSIRKLMSNYEDAKGYKLNDELYLGSKERQTKYPIIESENGVVMFSNYEQCSIEDIDKIKADYFLIDQPFVDNETNIKIVEMYSDYLQYCISDIQALSKFKQSRGFFYKKTLYKI